MMQISIGVKKDALCRSVAGYQISIPLLNNIQYELEVLIGQISLEIKLNLQVPLDTEVIVKEQQDWENTRLSPVNGGVRGYYFIISSVHIYLFLSVI